MRASYDGLTGNGVTPVTDNLTVIKVGNGAKKCQNYICFVTATLQMSLYNHQGTSKS